MGIKTLTSKLDPYCTYQTLSCSNAGCAHNARIASKGVIIDGPGLAYFIHNQLLGQNGGRNALEALPSYAELGSAVILYLSDLERFGLHTKYVLFDGFLPIQKRKTRLERLEASARSLISFKAQNVNGFEASRGLPPHQVTSTTLFRPNPASNIKFGNPLPFLVPAVFEALKSSRFSACTQLVPGEADHHLALAAKKYGGWVLSGDSDFMVHDLGEAIAVFHPLSMQVCEKCAGWKLTAKTFSPDEVVKTLDVPGMLELAFWVKKDGYLSLAEAAKKARLEMDDQAKDGFAEFAKEFLDMEGEYERETRMPAGCENSDNRVSELILQVVNNREAPWCIYLPPLLEDPDRASAWLPSKSIRHLAYSLLVRGCDHVAGCVQEFGRSGQRVLPYKLSVMLAKDIDDAAKTCQTRVAALRDNLKLSSWPAFWIMFALIEVYLWHLQEDRTPPSLGTIASGLGRVSSGRLDWQTLHLVAQVDGYLYSLRMLAQTTGAFQPQEVSTSLESLQKIPEMTPRLDAIFFLRSKRPKYPEIADKARDVVALARSTWHEMCRNTSSIPEETDAMTDMGDENRKSAQAWQSVTSTGQSKKKMKGRKIKTGVQAKSLGAKPSAPPANIFENLRKQV